MLWIVFLIALAGAVLNVLEKRVCFLLWMVSNGTWLIYNCDGGEIEQAATYAIFFAVSIWGWIAWGKKKRISNTQQGTAKVQGNAGTAFAEWTKRQLKNFDKTKQRKDFDGINRKKLDQKAQSSIERIVEKGILP